MKTKTFEFKMQIDASVHADPEELALAVHRAIAYAEENDVAGTENLNRTEVTQITIRPIKVKKGRK